MAEQTYTVGQVNRYIAMMFKEDFLLQRIKVKGEVSNCKYHGSGHIYFTLKDRFGAISCVMFASSRRGLTYQMRDGDEVVVTGSIAVYEKTGQYQLYARRIERGGIGDLYVKFEQMKKRLEEMGMFDPSYKKPIPRYASRIGVVTAPRGAAVRDIIQISRRRNPGAEIILYPALVQGEGAVPSIVSGIRTLDSMNLDVLIVGRGGGSIEDLWAFNEEEVARAIFSCNTPIISAVGHETDTTIADYVADLRAPTPSAAAELAVFDRSAVISQMESYAEKMNTELNYQIQHDRMRAADLEHRVMLASPQHKIVLMRRQVLQTYQRLNASHPSGLIWRARENREWDVRQLEQLMARSLDISRHRLAIHASELDGLSPIKKFASGYSYITDQSGHNLTSSEMVHIGDMIHVYLRSGELDASVTDKSSGKDTGLSEGERRLDS